MPLLPDGPVGSPPSALKGTVNLLTVTLNTLVTFSVSEGFVLLFLHRCLVCIKEVG